jgi:hypothetical protein
MMLGPISQGTHGANPWFFIVGGSVWLAVGWTMYLNQEPEKKVPLDKMLQFSAFGSGVIGVGIWLLFR